MPRGGSAPYGIDRLLARARLRIERHSIPEPNSGCWLWTRAVDKHGYGKTALGSTARGTSNTIAASRLSYYAFKGDPGPQYVLHKCDTPACVNPDHLWLGTARDNIRDCFTKGRARPRGITALLKT